MVGIEKATIEDAERLTEIQTRNFKDDNKLKPPGCSMEGPPGYDSVDWNAGWIAKTPYYKILFDGQIVGGIIIFELEEGHYELGRIYVDPNFQNRGIGQQVLEELPVGLRLLVNHFEVENLVKSARPNS